MNLRITAARRLFLAVAFACTAALVPAAALAAPGAIAHTGHVATPACATSGLDVWLDTQGSGAAGTIYYHLKFTNLSGTACTLFGYPRASGTDPNGPQPRSPATPLRPPPHTAPPP